MTKGAKDSAASEAIEAAEEARLSIESVDDDIMTFSNGVQLRAKAAPPGLTIKAMANSDRPEPPRQLMTGTDRVVDNPDHPDYEKRVDYWEMLYSDNMLNIIILFGSEHVHTPDDVEPLDSNDWVDKLAFTGMEVKPDNPSWRYLMWVNSVVCLNEEDYSLLMNEVMRRTGVAESDVKSAARFSGSKKGK